MLNWPTAAAKTSLRGFSNEDLDYIIPKLHIIKLIFCKWESRHNALFSFLNPSLVTVLIIRTFLIQIGMAKCVV